MISCLCVCFSLVCVWVIAPSSMTYAQSHALQPEHFSIWPEVNHCGAQLRLYKFIKVIFTTLNGLNFSIMSCVISDLSCESPVEFWICKCHVFTWIIFVHFHHISFGNMYIHILYITVCVKTGEKFLFKGALTLLLQIVFKLKIVL